jgi:hypothetical protein
VSARVTSGELVVVVVVVGRLLLLLCSLSLSLSFTHSRTHTHTLRPLICQCQLTATPALLVPAVVLSLPLKESVRTHSLTHSLTPLAALQHAGRPDER